MGEDARLRVNRSSEFLMRNEINRNGGKIDFPMLLKLVEHYNRPAVCYQCNRKVFGTDNRGIIRLVL